jgi:superfamily II DNA/RNA helicase
VDTVAKLLAHFRPESSIAFCNTKQQCRDVVSELQAQGFSALALFGELEQRERDEVLVQFANKSCSVLVATDVARAAWTSPICRPSSMSMSRPTPRSISTASAARAVAMPKGWR